MTMASGGHRGRPSVVATSVSLFAATMLVLEGALQVLQGIALLADDTLVATMDDYVYELDPTAWGWVQISLGVLAGLVGIGIFAGATWARITGVMVIAFSAVSNFALIPVYADRSIAIIALDMVLIWALCSLIRADRPAEGS